MAKWDSAPIVGSWSEDPETGDPIIKAAPKEKPDKPDQVAGFPGYVLGEDGNAKPIPGLPPKADKDAPHPLTEADKKAIRAEAEQKIKLIDSLKKRSQEGWFATGFGADTMGGINGTTAKDVKADTATVAASGALQRIMEMAKTNGGKNPLTPLSNADFQALGQSVANLDPTQSDEQFQRNLDVYRDIYSRTLEGLGPVEAAPPAGAPPPVDTGVAVGGVAPQGTQIAGESVKGFRFSPDSEGAIMGYVKQPGFTAEGLAQLMAQRAVADKVIKPEQADQYALAQLPNAKQFAEGVAKGAPIGGIDYDPVDQSAEDNAGVLESVGTALSNVPESTANLIQGLTALPADAIASAVSGERVGSFKSTTDLVAELASMAGIGDADPDTINAVGDVLADRYGGWDNLKRTAIEDPMGVAGDVSLIFSGGGTLAGRVPGVIGKTGRAAAEVGRVIDPISGTLGLLTEGVPKAYNAVANSAPGQMLGNAPRVVAENTLGLTTGVGDGSAFGRAFDIGVERGKAGAPTERSQNFVNNMRGDADPTAYLDQARAAVDNIRQSSQDAYRQGYANVQNDAAILDFAGIDNTLQGLQNRAFFHGQVVDGAAADVYGKINQLVNDWKTLPPDQFHTPEGMDKLKQKVRDVAGSYGHDSGNNRKASSIAKGVYGAVKQTIADQVPTYAATMKGYEEAQDMLDEVNRTFSLGANASDEGAMRKLQSVIRNNANTNYGYRKDMADMLDSAGPNGNAGIVDAVSGQGLNSWAPRGLQRLIPTAGLAYASPATAPALAVTSPRLMGEMHYGAGRAAGTVARGAKKAYETAEPAIDFLADKYNANAGKTLGASRFGEYVQEAQPQEMGEDQIAALMMQYLSDEERMRYGIQ